MSVICVFSWKKGMGEEAGLVRTDRAMQRKMVMLDQANHAPRGVLGLFMVCDGLEDMVFAFVIWQCVKVSSVGVWTFVVGDVLRKKDGRGQSVMFLRLQLSPRFAGRLAGVFPSRTLGSAPSIRTRPPATLSASLIG